MHSKITDDHNDGFAVVGLRKRSAGFVLSIGLHALALSALALALGMAAPPSESPLVVPVNIVQLSAHTAGPIEPQKANVPQQMAAPLSSPNAKPTALSQLASRPPDHLEIKLRKLAELREPPLDQSLSQKGEGLSRISATRRDAVRASDSTIRDFLRDQIEHHWSPDLAALHGRDISVMIRVAITKAGIVNKAEILDKRKLGIDPAYDEASSSARNAALLSSPLTLPPGHYPEVMDVVLTLDTQDALR
jgi:hypothetical protein